MNCEIAMAEEQIRELEKVLQMVSSNYPKAHFDAITHKKSANIKSLPKINQFKYTIVHFNRVYRVRERERSRAHTQNQIKVNKRC